MYDFTTLSFKFSVKFYFEVATQTTQKGKQLPFKTIKQILNIVKVTYIKKKKKKISCLSLILIDVK